ncbi:MAG: MFS transporter [Clostridia bacterium]|nr:MFS transporter [Clostridia bacterium]
MSINYLPTKIAGYVGFFIQAIVNNFLPILFIALQDVYKLNYEQLANLILFNFVTQIFVDSITPKIAAKLGYRMTAFLSQFTAFVGLALLGLLPHIMPPYTALIICIIIYATGSGIIEVILSPMIEMLPTRNKAKNMVLLHSFYCWGQAATVLITTMLIYLLGFVNWMYVPLIWSIVPFVNMFGFLKVPIVEPNAEQKTVTLLELLKNKKFIVFMIVMLCGGASEIAMAEWASLFVQNALGVSKVIGDISGPCAFAIFMGSGRILYAKFSRNLSFVKSLIVLSVLCFICYLTVAICHIPVIALIGCALCGFTVSISWPGLYSEGAKNFKNGGAVMFGALALCGDAGCTLGPWLVGIVADKASLNLGMALASIFPLIMVLCGIYILKNKDCKMVQ